MDTGGDLGRRAYAIVENHSFLAARDLTNDPERAAIERLRTVGRLCCLTKRGSGDLANLLEPYRRAYKNSKGFTELLGDARMALIGYMISPRRHDRSLERVFDVMLRASIVHDDRGIFEDLLAAGANPNPKTLLEPIHVAAMLGRGHMVRRILAAGACIDSTTSLAGETPLYMAVERDQEDMVRQLLAAGADPNIADHDGTYALHLTARREGSEGIIRQLLEAGADPNAQDCEGETPLHHLSRLTGPRAINTARRLLNAGADPRIADHARVTPWRFALKEGRYELAALLYAESA